MLLSVQPNLGMATMAVTVIFAAWNDWKVWRIPNWLLAGSVAVAMLLAAFTPLSVDLASSLLGGLVGLSLFMPFYLLGGMTAGDVKLLGVLGMHVGPATVLYIALSSAFVGGLWAIILIIYCWAARRRQEDGQGVSRYALSRLRAEQLALVGLGLGAESNRVIPYGVVLALGSLVVLAISVMQAL